MKSEQRKELDELVDRFSRGVWNSWDVGELASLAELARLGASVAAPRDDEIEAMALEIANQIRRDYGLPTVRELPIDAASNELRRQARAALSALRESKP